MGFVNSGAGFGGLIFAPLMAVLVDNFGWRHALYVLALNHPGAEHPRDLAAPRNPRDVGQLGGRGPGPGHPAPGQC